MHTNHNVRTTSANRALSTQSAPKQSTRPVEPSATTGMVSRRIEITPELAKDYFARNSDNRRLNRRFVQTLAALMRAGLFHETHQGIAFDEFGVLRDGQHRLAAIIESGTTQTMTVTWGVPREHLAGIDRGRRRSEPDNLKIVMGVNVTKTHVAIAKAMVDGMTFRGSGPIGKSSRDLVGDALARFLERHADAIEFAMHAGNGKGGFTAACRSVVARAYYYEDHERLRQFLELVTGYQNKMAKNEGDVAAQRLKEHLLTHHFIRSSSGSLAAVAKTTYALRTFLAHRGTARIFEDKKDPWPLEDEN